ncbi:DMT family transporter [Pseudooctadecabacter jejudonensis]|uniref:Riboflavin transporter n=1 Tax=Pseudooctadecabacter jejudonensis TaxID=1391910 RepID=A0A1Y5RMJ7_9RHOB|nr:DMT family transporter [Pseudooctadecabacter jejudonensis]SLN20941.1 Riboflavin transporter [Pseudooctadecabacter jejudonensis]
MTTAAQTSVRPDRIPLGMALIVGFCLVAPLLDVCAKLAADHVPVGQITAARFLVQTALMLPVCLMMRLRLRLSSRLWPLIFWRAVFLILSTYLIIAALRFMPLADALAIVFVEPFIILLFGKLMFGEQIGPRRIMAACVGFTGCLLVIQPSFVAFGLVALLPLGTAVSFAAYVLVTRALRDQMHPVEMQFQTGLAASLLLVPLMVLAYGRGWGALDLIVPQGIDWALLFGVGFFATVAHMMMTYALSVAPAATLAPLHYLEIITAAILGYLVFDDIPNGLALWGIVVIMVSGLYVVHRERATAAAITQPPGPI